MRLTNPAPFHVESQTDSGVSLRGMRGEQLRITALTSTLIRVEHLPDGRYRLDRTWSIVAGEADTPLEGRKREDRAGYDALAAEVETTSAACRLRTNTIEAALDLRTGALTWTARNSGAEFAGDLPLRALMYDRAGRSIYHYMKQRPDEHYYGFGEVVGALDKRQSRIRMANVDAAVYDARVTDPLYKHIPFYITYLPDQHLAYGLFYDNLAATTFDMGRELNGTFGSAFHYYQAEDGDLDYYLIYGPSIERVIEQYTWLTGRPALLPEAALGYLGSTMTYTEAPDAQAQLAKFAQLCQEHDIPCDLFHMSSGYTTGSNGKRYVFNWNRERVPDPTQMVQTFHDAGILVAPNIKPHLLKSHPRYAEIAERGGFLSDPESGAPASHPFWSGGLYEVEDGALLDFTDPQTYDWWKAQIKAHLLSYGIDAIWNDNNEFEMDDDDATCDGFDVPFRIGLGGRGLQTLLMGRASFEALREFYPHRQPFVLSRAGVPGIQRYAQTWSGDNSTSWETLRWNMPMGLGLSLSGVPNTGHDIGGFFGPAPDPELFVRWVQAGVFFPRFAIHSWNTDGTVNEPWMYPEVLPLIREAINLRYRLKPHLAALMREAHATGHPIMRPLVYHYAEDARCRGESFDFMLGGDMLIAPVLEPGMISRRVYLPAGGHGSVWVDFYSGTIYDGGQEVVVDTPMARIPVFVRAGASIALAEDGVIDHRVFSDTRSPSGS